MFQHREILGANPTGGEASGAPAVRSVRGGTPELCTPKTSWHPVGDEATHQLGVSGGSWGWPRILGLPKAPGRWEHPDNPQDVPLP